ncbi:NAD-binding protein [Streptomyces cyaneus]|uniref:NAD-binding protein n=1 Tax=Streptomyces cyaneus TaxID=1904 RepID=UPI000FF893D3|nr:NAD-binding protein [Streptomyces cyaneus]
MVVCGDDGLAHRLAAELRGVYGEQVTLVVPPSERTVRPPVVGRARAASAALLDRVVNAAVNRAGGGAVGGSEPAGSVRVVEAAEATEEAFAEVGVERAAALALVYDDDETNIRAALTARRLNPRLRLVLRLYNRRLGQHIEELLDQAATLATGTDDAGLDPSTTVLSDADTAAPALAASAVAGTTKVVQTDGLLLRAVERPPLRPGQMPPAGLATLALLSTNGNEPAAAAGSDGSHGSHGSGGSDGSGEQGPLLLPDAATVQRARGRGRVVLEQVSFAGPSMASSRGGAGVVPAFASLFSRRLRWSLAGLVGCVAALAVALTVVTGEHPLYATYMTLLDLFAINEPALHQGLARQILQLLSGLMGLLLLPVLLAAVLEALGTFRSASALRKPPRGLGGHVVLLGLGKIGTRVLTRLRELHIPVVCVEADPEARGLATARRLRVPVVLGDVTQEGVLEAAKIHRAHALLAVTSADTTNLEAALYARSVRPDLRVVLRLYDDDFATAVYRTLRAAHPYASTRSRSVTHLAAPAFAGAMMGRQILGAIPVERRVLLFAAVDVAGHAQLEDKTVGQAFRAGAWRVLAVDRSGRDERRDDRREEPAVEEAYEDGRAGGTSGWVWDLPDNYVLQKEDRVVLAATRRGLAELLGRRSRERAEA